MILDSSALIAVVFEEPGWQALRTAIAAADPIIPAPTLTEVQLVTGGRSPRHARAGQALIETLLADGLDIIGFEQRHADITATAREHYGKGNGRGGLLNFGDLLVYAVAKERGQPLLCTGRDFASTDLELHPASRLDP